MHEDSINNEDFSPSSINPAAEADQEQRRLPFLDDVTTDFAPTSEFNVRESAISKVSAKREKEYLGAIPYWDRLRGEGPCYVIDLARFRKNLQTLRLVSDNSGAKILLALKAFSMHQTFPLIQKYLHGACASSLHEARLAHEKMGGETHYYSPAMKESDIPAITRYADHVIFNSVNQWCRFAPMVKASERSISCGIRINPEYSVAKSSVYDPCAPQSRLGITFAELEENKERMQGIEGLHFHNLCQQGSGVLAETLEIVERRFGEYLKNVKWVNFGGGHLITAEKYDTELLCELVRKFRRKYNCEVYLEPGEAVVLNCGSLIAEVVDLMENNGRIAVIDASLIAHIPDAIEFDFQPDIQGAVAGSDGKHTYRVGGSTCISGDVFGIYSFANELHIGEPLLIKDMAQYTMVRNTTFNGLKRPGIATYDPDTDELQMVKRFGFEDFRDSLS